MAYHWVFDFQISRSRRIETFELNSFHVCIQTEYMGAFDKINEFLE